MGIEVIAYDISPLKNHYCKGAHFPVAKGRETKASKHPDKTLFLCWPPYDDHTAVNTLTAYKGKTVIYIGEGYGGCTGDDVFHEKLNSEWIEVDSLAIPKYEHLHDYLYIYKRA